MANETSQCQMLENPLSQCQMVGNPFSPCQMLENPFGQCQMAGNPIQPVPNAGKPIRPMPNAGKPIRPVPNGGKPTQPMPNAGQLTQEHNGDKKPWKAWDSPVDFSHRILLRHQQRIHVLKALKLRLVNLIQRRPVEKNHDKVNVPWLGPFYLVESWTMDG